MPKPPPAPPPPSRGGGAPDAAANIEVHTFWRYRLDRCWKCRRVSVLGKVGEVWSSVPTEMQPHCTHT